MKAAVRLHLSVTAGRMKNIHRWIPNTRVTCMEEKTQLYERIMKETSMILKSEEGSDKVDVVLEY